MAIEVRRALESDGVTLVALRRRLFQETDYMLWEADEFTQSADDESKRITRLNTRPNSLVILAGSVAPNLTLNRTCKSVRRPGLISFWPGRRPLPRAG